MKRGSAVVSGSTSLDIALTYGRDLTLRVADDGVGMELSMAEHGKDGHSGLRGMRERAARIGATLSVTSVPGAGTAVVLTVPGRAIFRNTSSGLAARLSSMLSGTHEK
jgi:nitrate/nitrite-specific signal transduction histidine kinase